MKREAIAENEFRDLVMRHTIGLLSVFTRRWGTYVTEKVIEFLRRNGYLIR
jgi:hypothetical protein